jgi:hypothetical protein
MSDPNSSSTARLTPPTEVPTRTLPPLLQLVQSTGNFARKLRAKSQRRAKTDTARTEGYECEDLTLPSVSSF